MIIDIDIWYTMLVSCLPDFNIWYTMLKSCVVNFNTWYTMLKSCITNFNTWYTLLKMHTNPQDTVLPVRISADEPTHEGQCCKVN